MAKKAPEATFGTRIQNAKNFVNTLQSFTNYTAYRPEDAIAELQKLIELVQISNKAEASYLQTYSLTVDSRQKTFGGKETGLKVLVTLIIATLRAQYGENSKETAITGELIKKIRGESPRKDKLNPDEKSISTSQQSYASITQNFDDLIASLEVLKPAYAPTNVSISLDELKARLKTINKTTDEVIASFNGLNKERQTRNALYADLKTRIKRIKEAVKSQYGIKSNEYITVKGMVI